MRSRLSSGAARESRGDERERRPQAWGRTGRVWLALLGAAISGASGLAPGSAKAMNASEGVCQVAFHITFTAAAPVVGMSIPQYNLWGSGTCTGVPGGGAMTITSFGTASIDCATISVVNGRATLTYPGGSSTSIDVTAFGVMGLQTWVFPGSTMVNFDGLAEVVETDPNKMTTCLTGITTPLDLTGLFVYQDPTV